MDLPVGYELRAPTPADLDAVADVLAADDLDDAGQIVLDADFLRDEWRRVGFDLATDAWVVDDSGGTIVAYGQAVREEPAVVESWGVVHPEHRRRGIESSLLNLIEERASRLLAGLPSGRFRHAINAGDHPAAAMLRARGLRPVRHFSHMQIDLGGPYQPGPAPEGVEIAAIEPPDGLPAVQPSSTRRSPTTGAIIPSRSRGGPRSRRRARATTRRCGCWQRRGDSRSAPSPRASRATAAG